MIDKPTVCLALDGFLATETGWRGRCPVGPPRPGAAEFTRRLARTFRVVVLTTRLNIPIDPDRGEDAQREAVMKTVRAWLADNKIWYDEVTWIVPHAAYYVGPRMIGTALNPTPDDFVQAERELHTRQAVARK